MRLKILLSCLLIVAVVVTIPQALVSLGQTDASTTTVTLTTIYPIGTGDCGVGSAVIPFTGPVHVEFQSESLSMDVYVVQNLAYIPCGVHLSSAEMTQYGGSCVFAESMVNKVDFDVTLPTESHYAIFIVAWNQTNINGATATIVMNGASSVSTEVNLTPVTNSPSNTVTQSSSSQMALTPTNSLQMPQQPQSITQPTFDTPELALVIVVIAAIGLYLLVRRRIRRA